MKRFVRITLKRAALLLLFFLVPVTEAQTAGGTPSTRPLVVTGSSTVYPLVTDIARRFERLNPGVTIEVHSGGSAKGLADLRADANDIAMVSRPLTEGERGLFSFPVCRDAAVIVVHRTNPVNALTIRQLTELLTGGITDWKQLGGRPGAVRLAWRSEGQAIPDLLFQHLKLKPEQIRSHATFFENSDAVKFAANDRNAITVAAFGVAERNARAGAPVKLLAYEGVTPTMETVREHTYALSRPLLLVTRTIPAGLSKRFIDYAASGAVTDLHEKRGFVTYRQ